MTSVSGTASGLVPLPDSGGSMIPIDRRALGTDLLQTFLGLILYGFTVHQTYRYFRLFPTDAGFIRTLVVLVMVLETVHAIFGMHSCYYLMVTHFFAPQLNLKGVWSLNSIAAVSSAIILVSQIFFARRVFLLGSIYRIIVAFAMLAIIGEIALSIGATHLSFHIAQEPQNLNLLQRFIIATLGLSLLADLLFSGALITVLYRTRARLNRTESRLDLITIYVVNTGIPHFICNVVAFVIGLTTPPLAISHSLYLIFSTLAIRLYAISLLSTLNSRQVNRGVVVVDTVAGPNVFHLARRRAVAETWNVPQVEDGALNMNSIQVGVSTEMEGRKWDFATSSIKSATNQESDQPSEV